MTTIINRKLCVSQPPLAGSNGRLEDGDGKPSEPSMVEAPESVAPSLLGDSEVDPDDDQDVNIADLGHVPPGSPLGERLTRCMSGSGNDGVVVLVTSFGDGLRRMLSLLQRCWQRCLSDLPCKVIMLNANYLYIIHISYAVSWIDCPLPQGMWGFQASSANGSSVVSAETFESSRSPTGESTPQTGWTAKSKSASTPDHLPDTPFRSKSSVRG